MDYKRLCESDYRFMCVVWDHEPTGSMELVRYAEAELGWKKSTTFTMIRKLAEKGLIKNEDSVVTALIPREEVLQSESRSFVEQTFAGSLPGFLVSFFGGRKISEAEAEELKKIIDSNSVK